MVVEKTTKTFVPEGRDYSSTTARPHQGACLEGLGSRPNHRRRRDPRSLSWGHTAGKPMRWDFRLRTSHISWKSSGGQNRRMAAGSSLTARASFSSCGLPQAEAQTIQSLLRRRSRCRASNPRHTGPAGPGSPPNTSRAGFHEGRRSTDVLGENADLLGRDPREAMRYAGERLKSSRRALGRGNAHRRGTAS